MLPFSLTLLSKSVTGIALLRDLKIELTVAHPVPFTIRNQDSDHVKAFKWESIIDEHGQIIVLTEEQQRKRCQKYVKDNLRDVLVRENLCVVGAEEGPNILSVVVPGYDIELVGRTDLLIMSDVVKEYPHYMERLPGVKMLIDVKRNAKTDPGAVYQTVSELIALDFLASDLVMALLTDFTDYWEFFWISDRSNNYVNIRYVPVAHPSAAFAMIRVLLTQSDAEISFPWVEEPVKRCKLKQVLPASEGGGSSGIIEAIERYRDIESVLGPDTGMAREVGRQVVRSIPIFSMYT
ncbi:hypothetical protein V7S43_004285 [Phytophthora oleae]|uniref:Uncharacterized protein n=1 Tax=Phytophthora oleae TaxID=2107226 RepID=A0ABD3FW00_9STRA